MKERKKERRELFSFSFSGSPRESEKDSTSKKKHFLALLPVLPALKTNSLSFFISSQGRVYAPVNSAYAPVRIDLTPPTPGDDTGDASGYNDSTGSKKRRAASRKMLASDDDEVVEDVKKPHVDPFGGHLGGEITISEDPLVRFEFFCFLPPEKTRRKFSTTTTKKLTFAFFFY